MTGEKTKLLIIGTNEQRKTLQNYDIQVIVSDKIVTESKSEKLLGLIISNTLSLERISLWRNLEGK